MCVCVCDLFPCKVISMLSSFRSSFPRASYCYIPLHLILKQMCIMLSALTSFYLPLSLSLSVSLSPLHYLRLSCPSIFPILSSSLGSLPLPSVFRPPLSQSFPFLICLAYFFPLSHASSPLPIHLEYFHPQTQFLPNTSACECFPPSFPSLPSFSPSLNLYLSCHSEIK